MACQVLLVGSVVKPQIRLPPASHMAGVLSPTLGNTIVQELIPLQICPHFLKTKQGQKNNQILAVKMS